MEKYQTQIKALDSKFDASIANIKALVAKLEVSPIDLSQSAVFPSIYQDFSMGYNYEDKEYRGPADVEIYKSDYITGFDTDFVEKTGKTGWKVIELESMRVSEEYSWGTIFEDAYPAHNENSPYAAARYAVVVNGNIVWSKWISLGYCHLAAGTARCVLNYAANCAYLNSEYRGVFLAALESVDAYRDAIAKRQETVAAVTR